MLAVVHWSGAEGTRWELPFQSGVVEIPVRLAPSVGILELVLHVEEVHARRGEQGDNRRVDEGDSPIRSRRPTLPSLRRVTGS